MKKVFLRTTLFAALLFAGARAVAQNGEAFAKKMTDTMKIRLPLTDSIQYQKMYDLNLKYIEQQQEVLSGAGGKMSKFRELKSLQSKKSAEAKALLSKEQYKNYQAVVSEMREQMIERRRSRKGGGNQ